MPEQVKVSLSYNDFHNALTLDQDREICFSCRFDGDKTAYNKSPSSCMKVTRTANQFYHDYLNFKTVKGNRTFS